jgi:protein-disulfide isomerase
MKPLLLVLVATTACAAKDEDLHKQVDDLKIELANTRKELDRRIDQVAAETTQAKYLERKLEQLMRGQDELKTQIASRPPIRPSMPPRREPDRAKTYAVPVDGVPTLGPADAKITLVRGYEYACPYCEKSRATMDQLQAKYGSDLRIVYKALVVHPLVATASSLAACAASKQGKFKQMDEALWEKGFKARLFDKKTVRPNGVEEQCWLTPEGCPVVLGFAASLGLSKTKMKADMRQCEFEVTNGMRDFQILGVQATPAFFVNGRYLSGALPFENFVDLIDEELAKANQRIQQGTPKNRYYQDWIVEKGQKTLDP